MKNLKDQKGITLVALVITIIVLLILAGVSLSLVVGDNGILGRASNTAQAQREAEVKEKVVMELVNLEAEYYQLTYEAADSSTKPTETSAAAYAMKNIAADAVDNVTISAQSTTGMTVTFDNGVDEVSFSVAASGDKFTFTKNS